MKKSKLFDEKFEIYKKLYSELKFKEANKELEDIKRLAEKYLLKKSNKQEDALRAKEIFSWVRFQKYGRHRWCLVVQGNVWCCKVWLW